MESLGPRPDPYNSEDGDRGSGGVVQAKIEGGSAVAVTKNPSLAARAPPPTRPSTLLGSASASAPSPSPSSPSAKTTAPRVVLPSVPISDLRHAATPHSSSSSSPSPSPSPSSSSSSSSSLPASPHASPSPRSPRGLPSPARSPRYAPPSPVTINGSLRHAAKTKKPPPAPPGSGSSLGSVAHQATTSSSSPPSSTPSSPRDGNGNGEQHQSAADHDRRKNNKKEKKEKKMKKKNRRSVSYNTLPSPHTTPSVDNASTSSSTSPSSPSLPSAGGLSMPDRFSLRSTKSYTSIPGAPSLSSSAISASASNLDDLSRPRKDFSIQTQLQQHFHLSANKYVSLLTATRHRQNAVAEEDDDGIDRSAWLQKALRKHPELQNLRERISPVSRAVAFGRTYNAPSTPDSGKEGSKPKGTMIVGEDMLLDKGKILQLIMQHLYHEGLKHSAHVLSGETNTDYMVNELNESRLVTLVRIALRDTERIWDLTVADKSHMDRQGDDDLEEHLNELEMLEEEPLEKDVNIWQEPVTGNITWSDKPQDNEPKSIHSASLNKLVENLTSPANPNMTFLKTFLLTYTTFTTAEKLLHKLIERYHVPQDRKPPNIRPEDWNTTTLMPIRLRVCNVLRKWIEEFEDELSSTRLLRTLKTFLETTLKPDGYVVLAEAMSAALARKMKQRELPPATITEPPPEPKVPRNVFSPSLSLMDINDEELARQLTLMEFETFRAIRPSELLNQVWNKPKQRHRAPNVVKMIRRFNEISNWVATSIVSSEKIRQRVKVMTKFLRLADILRKMNNFNTMVAVVAGINASAVHRLKWTKEEVMKGIWPQFAECERLMSNEGSYKTYRGALFQARPPCLPYLGVYLTDLTFIEDGNPDYVNELINFSKRSLIYTVIAKIQQFQLLPYNFYPIHQIWEYIKRFPSMEEAELYSTSLKIEPRKADRSEIL